MVHDERKHSASVHRLRLGFLCKFATIPKWRSFNFNGHVILHFSRMQDSIALSSAEAELKSTCKGLSEALGLRELVEFLTDQDCSLEHLTDASACLGILKRSGCGRVKHLAVRQLWCQEVLRRPRTSTRKIPRDENPADLLCSVQTQESLGRSLSLLHFKSWHDAEQSEGGGT